MLILVKKNCARKFNALIIWIDQYHHIKHVINECENNFSVILYESTGLLLQNEGWSSSLPALHFQYMGH